MYFKRVKRKCSVRGCKNTDSFHISRNREVGNSVIICKECLEEGLKSVSDVKPKQKKILPKPPSLFYQKRDFESSLSRFTNNTEKDAEEKENEVFICEKCGKEYKTEKAYLTHAAKCEEVK